MVLIAGGGTGGHLFPGVAVGNEILRRHPGSEVIFVTGGRKIESEILKGAGFDQVSISVEGLKGQGWGKALKAAFKLPLGLYQAISIVRRFSPELVFGVGGYSSGPVCLGAKIMGVPTAIHEQNSFPGITNRLLSRIVDRVFISFEESRGNFPGGLLFFTGNPVRGEFLNEKGLPPRDEEVFTILVTGGSQGAVAINRIFVSALEIMKARGKEPRVIHHAGSHDFDRVVREYREKGLHGDIRPFIQDMVRAYHQADIFVGRAGAGTIFELAFTGRPSILIPYPYAANRHQETNARALCDIGGAVMIRQDELTGEGLADMLIRFMEDREALKNMGEKARKAGKPDAAKVIVDRLEEMIRS